MSAVVGCAAPSTRRAVGSISSSIVAASRSSSSVTSGLLEGPAAIGLKRTDPGGVPQRMYTSDPADSGYESASGAEEHEEAADAAASTHST